MTNSQITRLPNSSSVHSLDSRADPAQNLVRDGADSCRHLTNVDPIVALRADNHDLVAGRDLETRDVGHQHVHVDGADDRRALTADQDRAASRKPQIETISVAGR